MADDGRGAAGAASDSELTAIGVLTAAAVGGVDSAFLPAWHLLGARARRWMQRQGRHPLNGSPVLLLPGVHESPRFLDPFAALALANGRQPHLVTALHRNVRPITATALQTADYLERHDLRDVLIIAHSKGGLVGKQVMTWERTSRRIRGMVAVATPFSGSVFATHAPLRSLRDFSPADETLLELAVNHSANRAIVSAFPAFDPQIPGGSVLPDARANIRLPSAGHFRVLAEPELWALLRRALLATA
ncbi:alpha/beta hydrolase [Planctomonas sp. JC2975]|uniref:esterase/lipase family protein n=1 Tax=Planctomonas sp. JC2975 TaxID=2729626 RepID=UPI001472E9AC|nr:alpha/beta hydrolase [Planctomonas sp. JC2975]NNC13322.1 alpha/beta hydrolase [Planctomonas sp. JC2975]